MGLSSWPFATMIWKFGAGPVSLIASFDRSLILLRSASEMALVRAPVSMSPSRTSFSKSFEKYYIWRFFLKVRFVERFKYIMLLPSIVVRWLKTSLSRRGWGCFPGDAQKRDFVSPFHYQFELLRLFVGSGIQFVFLEVV